MTRPVCLARQQLNDGNDASLVLLLQYKLPYDARTTYTLVCLTICLFGCDT